MLVTDANGSGSVSPTSIIYIGIGPSILVNDSGARGCSTE